MSNEIKEFYDLDELTTLLSRNLNIDIENKKELSEVIFKLISKNHLTPYLEYRGLVGDVESYISYASYQIIETLLYTLEPTNLNGNVSESSNLYNYNPTLNSIKNLVRTFEHGYSTKPSQIEYKTHAIFRLSPLSIINTVDGIQVELGFDKPVAHIKKFIDYPIKNNEHEFYGYQLYRSKQVDTPKLKINDTCKLVFSRFDIEYFINSSDYNNIRELENSNSLSLEDKNSNLNRRARNQDHKIIAMMAILLSKKSSQFKVGEKPNASAINEEIQNLVCDLQINSECGYGLKSSNKRIKKYVDDFLQTLV